MERSKRQFSSFESERNRRRPGNHIESANYRKNEKPFGSFIGETFETSNWAARNVLKAESS